MPFHLGGDLGADFCVYRFFSGDRRDQLQAVMDADMLDPTPSAIATGSSTSAGSGPPQGGLCQAENPLPEDFSDLYTRLGGWTERVEPATTVDELFSFVPIDRAAAVYDPANYDSAAVSHLVIRNLQPGPYQLDDARRHHRGGLPRGRRGARALAPTPCSSSGATSTPPTRWSTSALAYRLDAAGLTIEWGNFASTPGAALPPTLLPGDPCDDTTVLCYDHSLGAWPP